MPEIWFFHDTKPKGALRVRAIPGVWRVLIEIEFSTHRWGVIVRL
jgi:hypothetical protein